MLGARRLAAVLFKRGSVGGCQLVPAVPAWACLHAPPAAAGPPPCDLQGCSTPFTTSQSLPSSGSTWQRCRVGRACPPRPASLRRSWRRCGRGRRCAAAPLGCRPAAVQRPSLGTPACCLRLRGLELTQCLACGCRQAVLLAHSTPARPLWLLDRSQRCRARRARCCWRPWWGGSWTGCSSAWG